MAAIGERWRAELRDRRCQAAWVYSTAALILGLVVSQRFIVWVESRPGVVLADPVLVHLPAIELTWPIFLMVYGGIAWTVAVLVPIPRALRTAFLAYGLMILSRTVMMAVTPLDPPPAMILLEDPVLALFGVTVTPTRDLFFSGHTATMALFAFVTPTRRVRACFAVATVAMGVMVLLQQVHYTVDVLVAPFMAFAAHRFAAAVQPPSPDT